MWLEMSHAFAVSLFLQVDKSMQKITTPNKAPRTEKVRYIILHCTEMADDAEAIEWWCDPEKEISPHYFIQKDASLIQLVEEDEIAWHAGVSRWGDDVNLNGCSIGIEISNLGEGSGDEYTGFQYEVLIQLLKEIIDRHAIAPANVLAHSDIAPERKQDPGSHFDWSRLVQAGVAIRP